MKESQGPRGKEKGKKDLGVSSQPFGFDWWGGALLIFGQVRLSREP